MAKGQLLSDCSRKKTERMCFAILRTHLLFSGSPAHLSIAVQFKFVWEITTTCGLDEKWFSDFLSTARDTSPSSTFSDAFSV